MAALASSNEKPQWTSSEKATVDMGGFKENDIKATSQLKTASANATGHNASQQHLKIHCDPSILQHMVALCGVGLQATGR